MKIQSDDSIVQNSSKTNKKKYNKDNLPKKKWITDSAIKEKLGAHVETSKSSHQARVQARNNEAAIKGESTDKELPETSLIKSDVQKNDPNDPTTGEKLKSVLARGAFHFSPQERENLERILGRG